MGSKRKLVLHFDINLTLLVSDPVSNINVSGAVNEFLAKSCWGTETNGEWEFCEPSSKGELHLERPHWDPKAELSYFKYLEKKMDGNSRSKGDNRAKFRKAVGQFSEHDGKIVRSKYEQIIEALKAPSNLQGTPFAFEQDGTLFYYILPAFWQLLASLQRDDRNFCIVLRTMGQDGLPVADAINAFAHGKHPEYPDGCSAAICPESGRGQLKRSDAGIQLMLLNTENNPVRTLDDEVQIYKHFSSMQGTFLCFDDYMYWKSKTFRADAGKPLLYPKIAADRLKCHEQHILFDDNIRLEMPHKSIADARAIESTPSADGIPEWKSKGSDDPMNAARAGCLVQTSIEESTLDHQYFINEVSRCEKQWEQQLLPVPSVADTDANDVKDVAELIKGLFKRKDKSSTGLLHRDQLGIVFSQLGEWTPTELDMLFSRFDRGDGYLAYEEMIDWIMSKFSG